MMMVMMMKMKKKRQRTTAEQDVTGLDVFNGLVD